jgi:hypothetical protein
MFPERIKRSLIDAQCSLNDAPCSLNVLQVYQQKYLNNEVPLGTVQFISSAGQGFRDARRAAYIALLNNNSHMCSPTYISEYDYDYVYADGRVQQHKFDRCARLDPK